MLTILEERRIIHSLFEVNYESKWFIAVSTFGVYFFLVGVSDSTIMRKEPILMCAIKEVRCSYIFYVTKLIGFTTKPRDDLC